MKSPWLDGIADVEFPPLRAKRVRVDVAVVGGGLAGVMTAALLKREGRTVALIEAKDIGAGESLRTTAHLTSVHDLRFHQGLQKFGEAGIRKMAEAGMAAVDQLESLSRELGIACDLERMPAYLYTESEDEVPRLEAEAEAARKAGMSAEITREVPFPGPVVAGVRYENQARFHPGRLLVPLASYVLGDGSVVYERSRVLDIHDGKPCEVRTEQGTVLANDVVVATDSPVCNRVFLHTKVAAYRTYAVAAWMDRDLPGLFWDTADPYHYTRTHPFAEGHLLIVGGKDHKVGERSDTETPLDELERYVRERFPVQEFAYRWSGQIEEPVDGLPYIGRNSVSQHVYVATGFAGVGMMGSTLSGMILRDLISGRPNPWSHLYAATRIKPLASFKRYVEENVDFPKHMAKDWLRPKGEVSSVDDIPRGQGAVTRVGAQRVAAYRNEEGALQAVSAVCTHLGCLVHFNSAEKSWDCPCHGSRFGTDGAVLHGPATQALAQVALGQDKVEEEETAAPLETQPVTES